jgi:CHC2-type zinc finger protein
MILPDILEVVGRYTSLRKVGREYIGLSPCHNDRSPSLRVNPDKGVFYCDPCGIGGDVIRFIEIVEKVSFKEALSILGMGNEPKPRPIITARQREAAEVAATWMAEQRRKINVLLGEVLEQIDFADEIGDSELADSFLRKQSFLRDLYKDLEISRYAADMLSIRPMIEAITEGVEAPEVHFEFPSLTPDYRARLDALARGEA